VFWATIQQHATMTAFRVANLEGHPAVQPKVLDFLSHNAAPKEMLESLRALIWQTQTSLATTYALATQAKSTADRKSCAVNSNKVDRWGFFLPA
jgi:bacterioferritin (cytochrome b1)